MKRLTIGKVAKATDVSVETVRYYEREGLLKKPERLASGYREYSSDTIRRIHFIKRAKTLGFTLKEIRELLLLRANDASTCASVKNKALQKIADINQKIETLTQMRGSLETLVENCESEAPTTECPILDALDQDAPHGS